jgi:hypothetical protein
VSTEQARYLQAPGRNAAPLAPTKGLLPSTWICRGVRLEYFDAYGSAQETSGTLLDCYPAGPILNLAGAKTCLAWERLVLLELVED